MALTHEERTQREAENLIGGMGPGVWDWDESAIKKGDAENAEGIHRRRWCGIVAQEVMVVALVSSR
jgi:predicted secreted protein